MVLRRSSRGSRRGAPPPDPATRAALADLLARADALPDAADPLPAEIAVSAVLGAGGAAGPAPPERAGLVDYLGGQPSRPALALLRAVTLLGTPEERARATEAAGALRGQGVDEPAWVDAAAGPVSPGGCWLYGDVFGDQESVVCTFTYPGTGTDADAHALVVLVDHNLGGVVKDVYCTPRARRTLRAIGSAHAEDGPMSVLSEITPNAARSRLDAAFAATEAAWGPQLGDGARRLWALARARADSLPTEAGAVARTAPDGAGRALVVAEFLDSPPCRTLPDREVAAECARLVVDHGCDHDAQRPLRVSPARIEMFLLYWLPRWAGLSPAQVAAMPAVMEAWARWAGARQGLSDQPLREVVATAKECATRFPQVYRTPN